MAEVHLACAAAGGALRRPVAIKLLLPHLRDDPGFATMFLREAAIASRLDHPNIARIVDYGFEGDEHFLAMEFVDGQSLADILRESANGGGLARPAALSIVTSVAYALHHAHEVRDEAGHLLGLVHRDVSPANVLVRYDGVVKLVDFGIAKATKRAHTTVAGSLKGKMGYMSPEQCRCEPVDRRSDVFGLGILLYEVTLGRRLFSAANEYSVLGKVLRAEFCKPTKADPGFPPELESIILKCLELDRADRFATTREVAHAIERFAAVSGFVLSESAVAEAMERLFPTSTRKRVLVPDEPRADTSGEGEGVDPRTGGPVTLTTGVEFKPRIGGAKRSALIGAVGASLLWAAGFGVYSMASAPSTAGAGDPASRGTSAAGDASMATSSLVSPRRSAPVAPERAHPSPQTEISAPPVVVDPTPSTPSTEPETEPSPPAAGVVLPAPPSEDPSPAARSDASAIPPDPPDAEVRAPVRPTSRKARRSRRPSKTRTEPKRESTPAPVRVPAETAAPTPTSRPPVPPEGGATAPGAGASMRPRPPADRSVGRDRTEVWRERLDEVRPLR